MRGAVIRYKIDKDIPIPKHRSHWSRFPFKDLEVGDSFFVHKEDLDKTSTLSLISTLYAIGKKHIIETHSQAQFIYEREGENKGVRVFRIK